MAYSGRSRGGPESVTRCSPGWASRSRRIRRRGPPDRARRAGAWVPAVLRPLTAGCPRCAVTSRTPAGWSSPPTRGRARAYAALLRRSRGGPTSCCRTRRRPAARSRSSVRPVPLDGGGAHGREGVDVPRLGVGVYATTTSTPLFFAQAVGRFVRARGVVRPRPSSCRGRAAVPPRSSHGAAARPRAGRPCATRTTSSQRGRAAGRAERPRRDARRGAWGVCGVASEASSTGCCSTAASSGTRVKSWAATRRWTSSASRGCWSPTRCVACSGTDQVDRLGDDVAAGIRHGRAVCHERLAGACARS